MRLRERIRAYYAATALLILNALLLFALLNVCLWVGDVAWRIYLERRSASARREFLSAQRERFFPTLEVAEVGRLKDETWARAFAYEAYTIFKERPYAGKYVAVDARGFRVTPPQGPWPPERHRYFTVFLFGGSTTFGYGVPDDQTIAAHLQQALGDAGSARPARVYNFGRGYYYSTQERILFEQLVTAGALPDVAVFIDGLNEFRHIEDEPEFSGLLDAFVEGKIDGAIVERLPAVRAGTWLTSRVARIVARRDTEESPVVETYPAPRYGHHTRTERRPGRRDAEAPGGDAAVTARIIARYVANKRIIDAVAKAVGVETISVWQPVPIHKYDLRLYPFAPLRFDRHLAPGYRWMAERASRDVPGGNFLWCADVQEDAREVLYIDRFHYSPHASRLVAGCIAESLRGRRPSRADRR